MTVAKLSLFATAYLLATSTAFADGLPLVGGRYSGRVLVFKLSSAQIETIDHYRTCQLERSMKMNVFTPYVFTLTPSQAAVLKRSVGYAPSRFEVFETVRGLNDAGPFWNVALRFSNDEFEVPLDLLLPDRKANAAHAVQGWKLKNPCFPKL